MKLLKQKIVLCFMIYAFWGVLYPQFSLVEESYDYIAASKQVQEQSENVSGITYLEGSRKESVSTDIKKNPREDFIAILNAKAGELQIRSKLWDMWKEAAGKN